MRPRLSLGLRLLLNWGRLALQQRRFVRHRLGLLGFGGQQQLLAQRCLRCWPAPVQRERSAVLQLVLVWVWVWVWVLVWVWVWVWVWE